MNFSDYQEQASKTDTTPDAVATDKYIHGLVAAAGGIADARKQHILGKHFDAYKKRIRTCLGDALWYIAAIARNNVLPQSELDIP